MRGSAVVLVATVIASLACGGAGDALTEKAEERLVEEALEKGLEKALEDQGGGNVEINDNSVTFQGNDGTAAAFGDGAKVPDGWPTDVPVYANGKVLMSMDGQATGGSAMVSLETADSLDQVFDFYTDKMAAYKKIAELRQDAQSASLAYESTDGTQTVGIIIADSGSSRTVTISYGKK